MICIPGYITRRVFCFFFGNCGDSLRGSCEGCCLCLDLRQNLLIHDTFPTFSPGTGFGTSSATLRAMPGAVKKAYERVNNVECTGWMRRCLGMLQMAFMLIPFLNHGRRNSHLQLLRICLLEKPFTQLPFTRLWYRRHESYPPQATAISGFLFRQRPFKKKMGNMLSCITLS